MQVEGRRVWPWLMAVVVLWAGVSAALMWWRGMPDGAGPAGDTFGAVNSLFSGLAFVALILTIRQQQDQIAMQRDELQLQREEMAASRGELANQVAAQRAQAAAQAAQARATTAQIAVAAAQARIMVARMEASTYARAGDQHVTAVRAEAMKLEQLAASLGGPAWDGLTSADGAPQDSLAARPG